jgi:hypothetical protein
MKTFIIIIFGLSVIHFLHSPSDEERRQAQQQRVIQKERELMTRNLLLVRQDIDNKLNEVKNLGESGQQVRRELEQLKTSLEDENKRIRSGMHHGSNYDSWKMLKHRSFTILEDTREAFDRVVRKMEGSMGVKRSALISSRRKINK